jgi:hypothetical protein
MDEIFINIINNYYFFEVIEWKISQNKKKTFFLSKLPCSISPTYFQFHFVELVKKEKLKLLNLRLVVERTIIQGREGGSSDDDAVNPRE